MDGVFMKKGFKRVVICFLLAALVWCGTLIADRERLNEELIRLHVVAASDSETDQALKLRVRDAVTASLQRDLANAADADQAMRYIETQLPKLEQIANDTLRMAGCTDTVHISLTQEPFDTRHYDTFSLPAGIYETLRIVIGEGKGENWWCVVFPTLCLPATTEGFDAVAAGAGFPDALTGALTGENGYELRFFILDALGEGEIWLRGE